MDGWMDGYGMDGWMDTAWMTFDNFRRLPTTSDDFRRLPTRKRWNIPMYSKDFLLLSALKSQK